jgi:hypothetical protein
VPPRASSAPSASPSGSASASAEPTDSASPSPSASPTESADASVLLACPDVPTGVVATPGDNSVVLTWDDPRQGDQAPVPPTSYRIRAEALDDSADVQEITIDAPANAATLTGLRNGRVYAITMIAINPAGESEASEPVEVTPTNGIDGEVSRLVVEYETGVDPTESSTVATGAELIDSVALEPGKELGDGLRTVELSEPVSTDEAKAIAEELTADPRVVSAEPDQIVTTASFPDTAPDDTSFAGQQWNLWGNYGIGAATSPTEMTSAYSTSQGKGTRVAVIDTGITPHADFGDRLLPGYDFVSDYRELAGVRDAGSIVQSRAGPVADASSASPSASGSASASESASASASSSPPASSSATATSSASSSASASASAVTVTSNGELVSFDGDYVNADRYGAAGWDANPADSGDWRKVAPVRDSSWHGTSMAGIIGAEANNGVGIVGVAPKVQIQPIRALSWRGGLLSDVAASITWASGGSVPGVPDNATPANVINLSFATLGMCTPALQTAIDGAVSRDVTVVAAAGNANDDVRNYAPANCEGVVSVGASDKNGKRAVYSNFGEGIDVSAPGGDLNGDGTSGVYTLSNEGAGEPGVDSYTHTQGTSVAAAHVTGAIARLIELNPKASPSLLRFQITGTSSTKRFADDVCDPDPAKGCGSGIVQIAANSMTNTFNYTGAVQTWTVPAGVTSIYVEALGANGGFGYGGDSAVARESRAPWL